MYERAAIDTTLGPLWHLSGGRTFFAGPLTYNARHQHGAPVYLAGLYGPFRLRIGNGAWTTCRTAMIPAGITHELNLAGEPLAVLYIEPSEAGHDALIPLLKGGREENGALVGTAGESVVLRDLYEDRDAVRAAGAVLGDLVEFSAARSRRLIDGRIQRAVTSLLDRPDEQVRAAGLARSLGLSSSRFQHLFTSEVGVPFRRYRAWLRMRRSIEAIVAGGNFTTAAHAAGFFDQAHFAHDFHRTFGAPASRSLLDLRR